MTACTDSNMNRLTFPGFDFAPAANFDLLKKAYDAGTEKAYTFVLVTFNSRCILPWEHGHGEKLGDYGVLAVEMETTALYTLAAKYGVNALSVLTVSDHIFTGEETTSEERQTTFNEMIEIALDAAIQQ